MHVAGEKDQPGSGGIYMVDVVIRKASLLERYFPGIHDGATVVPAKIYNPQNIPERVQRQRGLAEMSASQMLAAAAALRQLGYTVSSSGVEVSAVDVGSPADGVVRPGDVIVGAEGMDVTTTEDLRKVMTKLQPGDKVTLRIERGGSSKTVTVGTKASTDKPPRAIMGILIEPKLDLPVKISIDTGQVGGPSAGLAFALDIVDELGPKDIDKGKRIAATGVIDLDGKVGEIGGIKQKTIGAREAGAVVFLVPVANAPAARKYAQGLRIVAVSSLAQALLVLTTL